MGSPGNEQSHVYGTPLTIEQQRELYQLAQNQRRVRQTPFSASNSAYSSPLPHGVRYTPSPYSLLSNEDEMRMGNYYVSYLCPMLVEVCAHTRTEYLRSRSITSSRILKQSMFLRQLQRCGENVDKRLLIHSMLPRSKHQGRAASRTMCSELAAVVRFLERHRFETDPNA